MTSTPHPFARPAAPGISIDIRSQTRNMARVYAVRNGVRSGAWHECGARCSREAMLAKAPTARRSSDLHYALGKLADTYAPVTT